ncbi:MAG: sigma-70 family RNA polymerase sigma factor [Myxococcota bacterium]
MHEQHDPSTRRHRLLFTPHLDRIPLSQGLWQCDAPALSAEQERLHRALHHAIDHHLTDKQRQAITLFFFEGLSQGAIAHRLGVSQQTIQRRIYGARRGGKMVGGALQRLRQALEQPVLAQLLP